MIRTDREYKIALEQIAESQLRIDREKLALEAEGYSVDQVSTGLAPLIAFHMQKEDDIAWYEKARSGQFDSIDSKGIGLALIALRIAAGISQAELARRLGVSEASVSRDEINDYHSIKFERAQKIANVLGKRLDMVIHDNAAVEDSRERVPA